MAEGKSVEIAKHRVIEKALLAQITSGLFAPGDRFVSGRAVSEKYSVSVPTADKAIGNLTAKGYLKRKARQGTFVRDWADVGVDRRQADTISLMYSENHLIGGHEHLWSCNEHLKDVCFCAELQHHASLAAEKRGCQLVFCAFSDDEDYRAPLVIRNRQSHGNLILSMPSEQQMKVLLAEDVGHLFVGNQRNTFGQPSVHHDMEDAGYQITKGLVGLGRGPVWMVVESTRQVYYAQELLDGYQRALQEQPRAPYHVYMSDEAFDPGYYEGLTAQMLASGEDHFCMMMSYRHVVPLLEQLRRAGIGAEQTTIVVKDSCERDWPYAERLCLCETSAALLAGESVRQIMIAAENGSSMPGKVYKLHYERTDEQLKPLRFFWK